MANRQIEIIKIMFKNMILKSKEMKIEKFYNSNSSKVVKLAKKIKEKQAIERLKSLDINELRSEKNGLRIKPLVGNGYSNCYQIYKTSIKRLAKTKGISEHSAREIKEAATRKYKDFVKKDNVKLSLDNKGNLQTNALKNVITNINVEENLNRIKNNNNEIDLEFNKDLKDAKKILSPFWILKSTKTKQKTIESFNNLIDIKDKYFDEHEKNYNDFEKKKSTKINDKKAWEYFDKNPIEVNNKITSILPKDLRRESSYELLDEAIKDAICAIELTKEKLDANEMISNDGKIKKLSLDGLKCTLRNYQEFGVKYIVYEKKVLLGDEMGLGKTIEAISSMVALRNLGKTHFMVICPASVLCNWQKEIIKHSNLPVIEVHGKGRDDEFKEWKEKGGVCVTTYTNLENMTEIENVRAGLLVVDEAHYVKNPEANRTRYTKLLSESAERVLFMTGTALENKVSEMVSLVSLLKKDVANKLKLYEGSNNKEAFKKAIAPCYIRRKREEVLSELPDLIEKEDWCTMGEVEKKIYNKDVLNKSYMKSRRVSFNVDNLEDSCKFNRLCEIIEMAESENRKVIVFSFFRDTLNKVVNALGEKCAGEINGEIPSARRQQIIDEFEKDDSKTVLAAQIIAGGVGLNIQAASVVVICEPQFKPSAETQAIARAYRMGQSRNVLCYRLLCEKTVDEKLIKVLKEKQNLFDDYADKSVIGEESLSDNSFNNIMDEEYDRIVKEEKIEA